MRNTRTSTIVVRALVSLAIALATMITWGYVASATAGAQEDDESLSTDEFIYDFAHVIAGTEVSPEGKYPFVVSLWKYDAGVGFYPFCGGSIIDEYWILTAAHCFYQPNAEGDYDQVVDESNLGVLVAAHDLSDLEAGSFLPVGERLGAAAIIIHPDYDPAGFNNDVALIELASPVTRGESIRPAGSGDSELFEPGALATVIGWGDQNPLPNSYEDEAGNIVPLPENNQPSPVLLEVTTPILDDEACTYDVFESATQICASPNPGTSCQGDSGGPVVSPGGASPSVLIGVVSYGYVVCGEAPSVYAEVGAFQRWILRAAGLLTPESRALVPVCIESDAVQSNSLAASMGVGGIFAGSEGKDYLITTGDSACEFGCAGGFDVNCDGILGDYCPVGLDRTLVADVGACIEATAAMSDGAMDEQTPDEGAEATPPSTDASS